MERDLKKKPSQKKNCTFYVYRKRPTKEIKSDLQKRPKRLNASVQIRITPVSPFEFVPRDSENYEFLRLVRSV